MTTTQTTQTTQTPVIAARIAHLIAAGTPVPDVWDAIFGEGAYLALAGEVYDRLRAQAQA